MTCFLINQKKRKNKTGKKDKKKGPIKTNPFPHNRKFLYANQNDVYNSDYSFMVTPIYAFPNSMPPIT